MNNSVLKKGEIQHMVIFNLPYPLNSNEALLFIEESIQILSNIPGVAMFEAVRQVSPKNKYKYAFSMLFANADAYQTYNNHPKHVAYVNSQWNTTVTEFLEIDYEAMK